MDTTLSKTNPHLTTRNIILNGIDSLVFVTLVMLISVLLVIPIGIFTQSVTVLAPISLFFSLFLGILIAFVGNLIKKYNNRFHGKQQKIDLGQR